MSAGAALGAGAIVIASVDACAPKAGNSCSEDARSRAALTMGIPASVLVGGGVAMLAVGSVRLKRLRAVPMAAVSRDGALLGWTGRF